MDEDPFADLPNVNQGGGERGVATAMPSATPVTQYSIPRRVLGGRKGDELYDPGTARGVGSLENELTPGVVAVNPSVYPIGTIFRDGDTNEVFIAGDKHGNENPNVVDIYTTPSQYQGVSGTRNIVPIGQIPSSKIPKTAKGVSDLLSGYGKVPQGEGAYTSLGSKESDDPFADLPDVGQSSVSLDENDPFADLPNVQQPSQQQGQAQTNPDVAFLTAPSPTPEQTGKAINLPAIPNKEQPKIESQVEAGNIDLNKRPVVKNADGTISTVRSISIGTDKGETLIPTVSEDGRIMSNDEAIAQYKQTGNNLGTFANVDAANAYAQQLHNNQAKQYAGGETTEPAKRPVGFFEAAGRGVVGELAKYNESIAQGLGVFPYLEDKTLKAFGIDSDIYNRYINAVHATGFGKPTEEAMAIKPTEELTTGGKIGMGVGGMGASLPYMMMSGAVGAEEAATAEAFKVIKPLMPRITQGIQAMLPMAAQSGVDAVKQSAQQGDAPVVQAAKGMAQATATAVVGTIPLAMRSKISNGFLRTLEQGAYGYITGIPVAESQKVVSSWINGDPYVPSEFKEMAIQAVPMALMTGAFGYLHAPSKAPKLKPSTNTDVNKKEEAILASADAQYSPPLETKVEEVTPEATATTGEAKAPAPDLTSLILDQTLYDEGSPEWNAIQAQIDALNKPAETPAEAQPTPTNAIQVTSATEAMLRPQGAGQGEVVELSGVGEQKPEVPAEQAQAPKEEVVQITENTRTISRQYGDYPKGTNVEVIGEKSKDPLDTNLLVRFPDGRQEKFPINWLEKPKSQKFTLKESLPQLVNRLGRDGVNELLVEWQDAELSPDGKYILGVIDPRSSMKKERIPVKEFLEWVQDKESNKSAEQKSKEAEAPKEEVKPPLPKETKNEFLDFAKKQGGLTKAQAQKALVEYEKAGNIIIGDNGEMLFTKPEHSTRESLRKAAGIEEAPTASKSQPIRDLLRRFQSGEEDSIDTLKGLADAVSDLARKTKNKRLADLSSELEEAVSLGVEIENAEKLVERSLAAMEDEAIMIDSPKKGKQTTRQKRTKKDKAREVFGNAVESLSQVLESKILDPIQYKRMVRSGMIEGGGEYDFFYNHKFPKKVRELIFSKTGERIDVVSDNMGFKDPTELLTAIDDAYRSAERINEQTKALEKDQADIEEKFRKMEELKKTDPDAYAGAVEEDARTYLRNQLRREGGYTELPQIIYDAAVSVGRSVAKATRDFKSWSGEMVNRLGDGVKGYLRQIWGSIKGSWNKDIGGGFDTGGRSRERAMGEAERYGPKAPTEQEAFAKKAADAILKGRGTPITQEEMANILARKFPGISPAEVADLYATASGKPKPPAPYAGGVETFTETPEQISIRKKDQADQVKRGILTSVIDTAQGLSDANLIERGRQNLENGVDPNQALEQARQGEPEAISTARAYFETVLAPRASEALKTKGAKSPEYLKASKEATDYYQGIREGLSAASEALRTAKGQVDLTDASAIAREYTIRTGEEPTLSQHEQIRKIADKVDRTIKESDEASDYHQTTMNEGLAEVEVQTPTSVEEARQQVADLSDAQGKKAKDEIDRLNNELEQTKRDLEEVRQAKATGQDAESLKAYYEAKLKDLQGQLESKPKFGKEVLDQAQKLVDKWRADRLEAEKLLTKQLAQLGSFPDVSIIGTIARIMRGHISELGLDFARSSKMILDQFGPKAEKYLKEAWAKADALIKGEDGGEKAVKTVRKATTKAKAKPVDKMTPAEKAAESLRKRIAQAEKKINDLNSGKITTPKEVEKVTNDEIKRLEDEYNQKKKELADARLKSKQRELFEKEKVGEDLNPEQVKTLWESAKRFYLDKGESDYDKMISDLASDFGITPQQVRKAFGTPKGAKRASDEMYLKQRNRQMALDEAKRWLDNQKASWIGRVFGAAAEKTFKLAIFGHGTAFIGTHAPQVLYTNPKLAFKAWLKGLSYSFTGKNGRIQNIVDNKDLINRPSWIVARKGGLENDPREIRREGATPARSDSTLAKALDTISGGRGFDALFHLRQDMFDQAWNQLSVTMRTPEMAEMFANSINNATGFTKGGKGTAGILQSPITKVLFFAPKLIASRFKWLIQDPARMLNTFGKMANPFLKVSPEERMSAIYEAKNKAKFLGVLTGTLLANQALLSVTGSNQSVNFLDPKKRDWLAYKGFGYELATIGAFTRIIRLIAQEYNAVFGELSRWQKAKGGREQAMKDALYTYLRSGLSPITRDIIVVSTGKDYVGNTAPWSKEQPDRGRRKLTWREIIQEQFAPIPISEAATQKEGLPSFLKSGSAAFLGTRLDTPADIEEYEKSLQSRARKSKGLGGIKGLKGFGKGL